MSHKAGMEKNANLIPALGFLAKKERQLSLWMKS